MTPERFPPALHAEVALVLYTFSASRDSSDDEKMRTAADNVVRYAQNSGTSHTAMVAGIKCALDTVEAVRHEHRDRIRTAYDRLVAECLSGYFENRKVAMSRNPNDYRA